MGEKPQQNENLKPKSAEQKREVSALLADVVKANKSRSGRSGDSEIPKFNLAEDIMAEHRRASAIKRKPPKAVKAQEQKGRTVLAPHILQYLKTALYRQEQIITEIVARDIEKLCGSNH